MSRRHPILHWNGSAGTPDYQKLIEEEPLAIRVDGKPYTVMMRTPGEEVAHAAGFCLTEGIVDRPEDIESIARCDGERSPVVTVTLKPERRRMIEGYMDRRGYISQTSCGLCGKQLVDDIQTHIESFQDTTVLDIQTVMKCVEEISEHQPLRKVTRSSHASLLYDAQCRLLCAAEDVGRHNALDKAIGKLFLGGIMDQAKLLILSSRISYELVQKAGRARIPVVVAVSRPTTLAVDLAISLNMTLACLSPGYGMFLFCGRERLGL